MAEIPLPSPESFLRSTSDASGDSYTVLQAIRSGHHITDWVILDANALVRRRWASTVGDVVGQRLDAVVGLGCDLLQRYLLARPEPLDDIESALLDATTEPA